MMLSSFWCCLLCATTCRTTVRHSLVQQLHVSLQIHVDPVHVSAHLVSVCAVVVTLQAVEVAAALLVSTWKGPYGEFNKQTKKRRGGEGCWEAHSPYHQPNDIAHFEPAVFVQFSICDEGAAGGAIRGATTKNELTFIIVIPNISGCPMIKFISFCPKMINSTDFVNPTIMPSQWLFFLLKYEY